MYIKKKTNATRDVEKRHIEKRRRSTNQHDDVRLTAVIDDFIYEKLL